MKHRETEKDTGLDDTCEAFVGQLLSVNPVYGWGWGGNKEEPKPPPPFEMRLQRLWWWSGIRRGGIGTVNTPSHPYHGWTVIFSTRHTGTFNFVDRPGYYNITITSSDLVERQGWPLPREKVEGACGGFCAIEAKSADPEGKEKK